MNKHKYIVIQYLYGINRQTANNKNAAENI